MKTAIYPGSFDPITLGHFNIVRRAAKIFDNVVVCVLTNSAKTPMFSIEERVELIERVTGRIANVKVESYPGLLADFARRYDDAILIKGLRALSDFDYEFQMALINKKINPSLDTLFMTATEKYTFLSSSIVKDMARFGADLSEFVPVEIIDDVIAKSQAGR